jgi:hypothetical protein
MDHGIKPTIVDQNMEVIPVSSIIEKTEEEKQKEAEEKAQLMIDQAMTEEESVIDTKKPAA